MTPKELYYSILKLAFSGKLLPQEKDEDVESFLTLTNDVKKALIENGEIKKQKKIETSIDEPFDIPQNWKWIYMCDFCTDIFSGRSPKYEKIKNEYRVIGQAANKDRGLDLDQLKYTNKVFWESNEPKMFVRKYDVLLNTLGSGTLGRSGIIDKLPFQMLTDGHPFIFRTSNASSSFYLYYYLQLKRSDIEKSANGSTNQTFLNLSSTKLWPIPVAPLDEQKRIVTTIEKLIPLVDRYEEAWNKLEAFNKQFPADMEKSILEFAIEGKITEHNHTDSSVDSWLKKVKETKGILLKEKKIKKDLLFDSNSFEPPFEISSSWRWVRTQDIFNVRSALRIHQTDWKQEGIPFFRGRELVQLSKSIEPDFDVYISEELYNENKLKGGVPQKNDILVSAVGTIGKTYIVKGTKKFYYKDAYILCYENFSNINPKYIKYVLDSPYCQSIIREDSMATTVAQLTIEKAKSIMLPIPPVEEQERIVAKLEELLPLCRKLIR